MNTDAVTAPQLFAAVVAVAFLVVVLIGYRYLDGRKIERAEQEMDDAWRDETAYSGRHRAPHDGATFAYDPQWPDTGLARFLDSFEQPAAQPAYYQPQALRPTFVPARRAIAPALRHTAPQHSTSFDTDIFIANMRERAERNIQRMHDTTVTFIAQLEQPLPAGR